MPQKTMNLETPLMSEMWCFAAWAANPTMPWRKFWTVFVFQPFRPWGQVVGEWDFALSPVLQVGFWLGSFELIDYRIKM